MSWRRVPREDMSSRNAVAQPAAPRHAIPAPQQLAPLRPAPQQLAPLRLARPPLQARLDSVRHGLAAACRARAAERPPNVAILSFLSADTCAPKIDS